MTGLVDEVRRTSRLPRPALARAIRLEAGVTQARMAAELGVDRVTIARWESGERKPRADLRDAYARLLTGLQEAMASHGD
jgi:transcriptional regulator with XRE-family HTH domain